MKNLLFFCLLLGIFAFSSVSISAQCDTGRLSPIQCGYFNEGYQDGVSDAQTNRDSNYRRYNNKLDSRLYERYYIQGYDAGFVSVRQPQNPYPIPNNPRPGRGTSTGTIDWSGRVDNRVNIVIRGNEIRNEQIAGSFSQGYQNMNGVLPRRNTTVSVSKLAGRGTATVIQQPDRNNNFTAIVQIFDLPKSDDDYRLQIRWQTPNWNNADEQYSSGRVVWRGRVDQRANIIISGSDVQSIDDSNSGLNSVNFNINGYLAARNGNVSVRKRGGRGSVTVLQQPSATNDYEAVIQIFDPNRGDDEYEIEITW